MPASNPHLPLVLASSSVFRQQQLRNLGLDFVCAAPDCDETPLADESPAATAQRLAVAKARSLASAWQAHLIIGADQVAWCHGKQLGKPMSTAKAQQMLAELSGQTIQFYSAVCLLNSATGRVQQHTDTTTVTMRSLSSDTIARYLQREPDAVYCAGGAKSEALGAALIQRIDSTDPNALIGLPIFRLLDFLAEEGVFAI